MGELAWISDILHGRNDAGFMAIYDRLHRHPTGELDVLHAAEAMSPEERELFGMPRTIAISEAVFRRQGVPHPIPARGGGIP